jgi:hypothetical protein
MRSPASISLLHAPSSTASFSSTLWRFVLMLLVLSINYATIGLVVGDNEAGRRMP